MLARLTLAVMMTAALVVVDGAQAMPKSRPGGAAAADISCKDRCQNWCMGNDTPTERAECLKREKSASPRAQRRANKCCRGSGREALPARLN
jgi:hypothetical protein